MAALNFQEVKSILGKYSGLLKVMSLNLFNFQADDKNMFNRAKFLQNGNCGFVLKPGYMAGNDPQEPNLDENVRNRRC